MRWQQGRRSRNVEDRRGKRVSGGAVGGGVGALLVLVAALVFGIDPSAFEGAPTTDVRPAPSSDVQPPENDPMREFVQVVLGNTEDAWHARFEERGLRYEEPTLVLFSDAVSSACGFAQAATGPFYCPADRQVYLDLGFFQALQERFGAPGDFAQAYVIAHEVGHHVQTLLGISARVREQQGRTSGTEANRLSVRQELQADCFAGIWAHYVQANDADAVALEAGDIEEALGAASAIGDDRLQRQARGYVQPETFTHGSSQQRVRWFTRGYESGDMQQCDTFSASRL